MAAELIDILDENGKKTGIKKTKKEAHSDGSWHQAAHVWIFNSKGEILLQKRSITKDTHPGLWDISAAGHLGAGETPDHAAIREICEEIGIKLKISDLKKVEVRKVSKRFPELNYYNSEFDHVYLWKFDGALSDLKLLDGEVERIEFIPLNKLEAEVKDSNLSKKYVPHGKYWLDAVQMIRKKLENQK